MRFAVKSRRGPHAPVGHNAPKVKKELTVLAALMRITIIKHMDLFTCFPGAERRD